MFFFLTRVEKFGISVRPIVTLSETGNFIGVFFSLFFLVTKNPYVVRKFSQV